MEQSLLLQPGQRVRHVEFGEGVVVSSGRTDFVRVFFGTGERQVPITALSLTVGHAEYIVQNVAAGERRNRRA